MLSPPRVPRNAEKAQSEGRAKEDSKKRGQSREEVRVRNQMGKESARPQALLYVVPKVCASAIWPFLQASLHPDRLGPSKRGLSGSVSDSLGRPVQLKP
jgi:hypothetical protein